MKNKVIAKPRMHMRTPGSVGFSRWVARVQIPGHHMIAVCTADTPEAAYLGLKARVESSGYKLPRGS